jgi:Predicted glycosyltransferases
MITQSPEINKKYKFKVAIVILNWNGATFLRQYLPSVVRHSACEWCQIVIADNGSTDESRNVIETEFQEVQFLPLDENFGFAKGYNEALKNIDAEYFLLLNSDIQVTEGWLLPLVNAMDKNPLAGACQPKILSMNEPEKFEYAGASGGFIDRLGYPFCRGRILNVCEKDNGQYNQPISVFWATGAAIMVRSSCWEQTGGFDPDFWAHMEEIDLCWRMRNLGYQIQVEPQSVVYHLGGGSLPYQSPLKVYLNFRNNLYLLYKNLPANSFFPIIFFRMVLDGIAGIQFLVTGQWSAFAKVLKAHFDFYHHIPTLSKQRKQLQKVRKVSRHQTIYKGSIIFDFFILRKRKFSQILGMTK